MSLIDMHESALSTSLTDTNLFGVPVTLIKPDDTEFTYNGQVNIISRHINVETDTDARGQRSNCTLRLSDITEMPDDSWRVRTSAQPSIQAEKTYLIEEGGLFPDNHLGILTIFLSEIEVVA